VAVESHEAGDLIRALQRPISKNESASAINRMACVTSTWSALSRDERDG
jgi:hypothetical protein